MLAMAFGLPLAGLTACSEPDDIVNSVNYSRLFSPADLEAKVQNTTGVRVTWKLISTATSYDVEIYADDENMTFSGTPALKFTATPSDIVASSTENALTIPAGQLEGETIYSIRLRAKGAAADSKWSATTFETGTEQILNTPDATEITKTSVTLSWPAGTAVTRISVVKNSEELLSHDITTEEKAAGKATIDGLQVESTYTFYIYNGEKQRGKIQVQTLPNYTPATSVQELKDALATAAEGEVIMLTENAVYDFTEDGTTTSVEINKNTIIKSNNNATIKGIYFQIINGASLEFANITLDGEGGSGDQAFTFKEAGDFGKLWIHDAEIKNYTKGFFYINVAAAIDEITIENCIIHDIVCSGGDMFDSRSGGYKVFNLLNNTIYNSAASRDFIRMDDASSAVSISAPQIVVDHNTLYNVGSAEANYRLLYVRFAGNVITFSNNIVAGTNYKRGFSNQKTTGIPTFKDNFYFQTKNLVSADDTADATIQFYDADGTVLDATPFADAASGDFTLVDGPAKYKEAGDPRWNK